MTQEKFLQNLQLFVEENTTIEQLFEKALGLLQENFGKQSSYIQTLLYDYVSNMRTLYLSKTDFLEAMQGLWNKK